MGWLRFVCANGLIIGETKAEMRDIHDHRMNLQRIPRMIDDGLRQVDSDQERLRRWADSAVTGAQLRQWVDDILPEVWGKKAACRAFHVCTSGFDVEYRDPFAPGSPSVKPVQPTHRVPGAPEKATNCYDVAQSLSWIASKRSQAEERIAWQAQIPGLVNQLQKLS